MTGKRPKDSHPVVGQEQMATPPPTAALRSLLPHMTTDKMKTQFENSRIDLLDFSDCVIPLRTRRQHKVILGQEDASKATLCEVKEEVKTTKIFHLGTCLQSSLIY